MAIANNRNHVIRRVRAGGGGASLPDLVALGCFRQQQPCRCSAGAHGAQAAQPAAGSRCSCGAGGHGARTAAGPLSECGPGLHGGRAAGDDRAETPGPLLRRRSRGGGVPGQPVPAAGLSERRRGSHAGGAGWGGSTVHSAVSGCCAAASFFVKMPTFPAIARRGAAIAGAPARWGSRWRLAAAAGERRGGLRSDAALAKGPLTLPRRSGRAPPRNGAAAGRTTATRPAQGPRVTRRYPRSSRF